MYTNNNGIKLGHPVENGYFMEGELERKYMSIFVSGNNCAKMSFLEEFMTIYFSPTNKKFVIRWQRTNRSSMAFKFLEHVVGVFSLC